jgi:hypothetical protein
MLLWRPHRLRSAAAAPRHRWVAHPRGGAGLDQITRNQRHTSPRSSGSAMLSRPPCSSHSIWRARADWAAACCNAIRTVSETPVVLSSRCAAARRSSSRSINLLVVGTPRHTYTHYASSIYATGVPAKRWPHLGPIASHPQGAPRVPEELCIGCAACPTSTAAVR